MPEKNLRAIHAATADLCESTVAALSLSVDEEQRLRDQCLQLASSGWHAFEAALEYLNGLPHLVATTSIEQALDCGDFGASLTGYTFEPARTYFEVLPEVIACDPFAPRLVLLHKSCRSLQQAYPQSGNLLVECLAQSARLMSGSMADHTAWAELLDDALGDRNRLLAFLKLADASVPWQRIRQFQVIEPLAAQAYLAAYETLADDPGEAVLESWQPVLLHLAQYSDLAELLVMLPQLPMATQRSAQVRGFCLQLDDAAAVACLLPQVTELPLLSSGINQWVTTGAELPSTEARCAYFSLQSSLATVGLARLSGEVRFAEHKRTLQLFAEAMTKGRLRLEELDPEAPRQLPQRAGMRLQMPWKMDLLPDRDDNFGFYKVAILHQAARLEVGLLYRCLATCQAFLQRHDNDIPAQVLLLQLDALQTDRWLAQRYPGAVNALQRQQTLALTQRPLAAGVAEAMLQVGLGAPGQEEYAWLHERLPAAQVDESQLPDLLEMLYAEALADGQLLIPAAVAYRGDDDLAAQLDLAALASLEEVLDVSEADDLVKLLTQFDPKDAEIEDIKKGEVDPELGRLMTELEKNLPVEEGEEQTDGPTQLANLAELAGRVSMQAREDRRYYYDEWDHQIDDYRDRWCTLSEIRDIDEAPEYVEEALREHADIARRVRRQMNRLKPELLRKVRGTYDGDELDMERTIAAVVDRKSGWTPDENIYVQRQRKERDVSALFLLDMSASTDDRIPDPDAEPVVFDEDDDDYLNSYWAQHEEDDSDRIIDIEKKAVILLADALEELGDSYSVCGFSGYGREQVEFYLCKGFTETFDRRARGRVGGIKPCRSTRMGPAIRHATRMLAQTESRIKALIIISDGYPQDHDYGSDRANRDYGIHDTMKALSEAHQQSVQSFCLTVDQSGHDYLRDMCPDQQYMVIQDIRQLPDELSKVYRSLTG